MVIKIEKRTGASLPVQNDAVPYIVVVDRSSESS